MKQNITIADKRYLEFVREMKERTTFARIAAARSVNSELIMLYWDIGKAIVAKQKEHGWGDSIVETLSRDLQKELPATTGFSADNLWRMRQFFIEYSAPEFLEQAVPEMSGVKKLERTVPELLSGIPWGHHVEILKKVKGYKARVYYLRSTARFGWSRNVLLNQIKACAYERARLEKKTHNFPVVMPDYLAEQADEAIKSSYSLEFLGIHQEVRERELEGRLIERLRDFILELGYGFCFVGRQYRLAVGQKEYFIDLLFYHRFLKALVAIELKVGSFEPEYAGKMDFYLNLLNAKEKAPDDNSSIGIILCAEKDDMVVEFSLKTKTNPIGVAEYHLTKKLPKELKGKLPSERELRGVLLAETPHKPIGFKVKEPRARYGKKPNSFA
jgi:predicted nuclease of restriction endonuclease-like (RecB) superfamily